MTKKKAQGIESPHMSEANQKRQEFERLFLAEIEHHRKALEKALRKLAQTNPPPALEVLLFESYSEWDHFPVVVFARDRSATDVYYEAPFSGELLPGVPLMPADAIDQGAFEDADVDTFETGARVLAKWFGECWDEAGGKNFLYIRHHDRSEAFDLRTKKWVNCEEMWE